MTPTTATAMETLGESITALFGWMKDLAAVILSNPLYLLFLGVAIVGACIGLVYRLIRG